jgi:hypothetical protein
MAKKQKPFRCRARLTDGSDLVRVIKAFDLLRVHRTVWKMEQQ